MPAQAINAVPTLQTFGPGLSQEAEFVTFYSFPSGSTLVRTIAHQDYVADRGLGLLNSLSDAVESLLQEDYIVAATGTQGLDDNDLIFDAVTFTVQYVPSATIPGQILGDVQVPVTTLTIDTQFGSFLGGASATDILLAEYHRLQALAGG